MAYESTTGRISNCISSGRCSPFLRQRLSHSSGMMRGLQCPKSLWLDRRQDTLGMVNLLERMRKPAK
jgi:hypothetical protein